MSGDAPPTTALDPSFFEGRLLVDILSWDWNLRVAINPTAMRPRSRFQGLDYGRDFMIHGRIRAPRGLRGKAIKLTLSPFGKKLRFGRGGLRQVGHLAVLPQGGQFEFEATVMLPEEAVPTTAVSLASVWKHMDIWTSDESFKAAKITAYDFSADIHPNLLAWANAD